MRRLPGGTALVALALGVSFPLAGAARDDSLDRVLAKTEAYVVQHRANVRFKRQNPKPPTSEAVPEGLPSTASFRARTEVWTIEFKESAPLLGLLVPVEMHESYKNEVDGSVITGVATYGRFRRFDVSVDQSLSPVTRQK
jgi:hypothetical protein